MVEILEALAEVAPEIAIVVCGIVNIIISIITYKKTGNITTSNKVELDKKTEDIINEDVSALIAYHETTANNLRETFKKK